MTKLFVASPMYGGQCYGFYTQSLLQLTNICREKNMENLMSFLFNESLITRGRNALVQGFMKTDCTHLMFVDADIRFNPNDVLTMLEADKEIICGIYPKKEINWNQVHKAALEGVPPEKLKFYTGAFVVNLKNYAG